MNPLKFLCFGALAALASCGANHDSRPTDQKAKPIAPATSSAIVTTNHQQAVNVSYTVERNASYIVFSKDGLLLASYKYKGTDTYDDYGTETPLIENSTLDPLFFVELYKSILVYNVGTSPAPHQIYFLDLHNRKQLLPDEYCYQRDQWSNQGSKRLILKLIGTQINQEQKNRLDWVQYRSEKAIGDRYPDSFSTLYYYEEYLFDMETRVLLSRGVVWTKLQN